MYRVKIYALPDAPAESFDSLEAAMEYARRVLKTKAYPSHAVICEPNTDRVVLRYYLTSSGLIQDATD